MAGKKIHVFSGTADCTHSPGSALQIPLPESDPFLAYPLLWRSPDPQEMSSGSADCSKIINTIVIVGEWYYIFPYDIRF